MYYKFDIKVDIITHREVTDCNNMQQFLLFWVNIVFTCTVWLIRFNVWSWQEIQSQSNVCALWSNILTLIVEGRVQLRSVAKLLNFRYLILNLSIYSLKFVPYKPFINPITPYRSFLLDNDWAASAIQHLKAAKRIKLGSFFSNISYLATSYIYVSNFYLHSLPL